MSLFWTLVPGGIRGQCLADVSDRSTKAGAAVYGPIILHYLYNFLVLGIYCSLIWRCPAIVIEQLHQMLVRGAAQRKSTPAPGHAEPDAVRVLDIGVGTGYFMSKLELPSNASLTLFDLNPNCLTTASTRCREAHSGVAKIAVNTVRGDFLAPNTDPLSIYSLLDPNKNSNSRYDVIFTSLLLHCLPGPPHRKAKALASLASLTEDTGILCGATILGANSKDAQHSWIGHLLLFWHNAMGWFDNDLDDREVFVQALEETFENVSWQVIGTVLLFEARFPKRLKD
ncbi:Putative uncharacterized protein YbcY [Cytospora mali]|uniref:Methyltransferase type 12 domain-containing protein n=1 Tax=Cytospora mali TaxID=578113 RepID=A0A194VSN1_CYTMA|nr:Putative uncharacterized protein YbcY [Valsa mali]